MTAVALYLTDSPGLDPGESFLQSVSLALRLLLLALELLWDLARAYPALAALAALGLGVRAHLHKEARR